MSVAGLGLWFNAHGTGLRLAEPECYAPFILTDALGAGLVLRVGDRQINSTAGWQSIFYHANVWQLWVDGAGRYVFGVPRRSLPPRQVAVDAAFTAGEVIGEFSSSAATGRGVYPLQGIDVMLYVNWLAGYGDLVLHASGVAIDGRGYAFAGPAGAGKSTLATLLMRASREAAEAATTNGATTAEGASASGAITAEGASASGATTAEGASASGAITAEAVTTGIRGAVVLGEDSVILRRLDGRFWIYGTPWHENPAMCAPLGVPLEKLFFLERNAGHGARPLAPADGIARLLQTAFVPYYRPDAVARILDNLASLAEGVPFYTLSFRIGADAMRLIGEA